jgi:hypothetical protein
MDFLWGRDAKEKYYGRVLSLLRSYLPVPSPTPPPTTFVLIPLHTETNSSSSHNTHRLLRERVSAVHHHWQATARAYCNSHP